MSHCAFQLPALWPPVKSIGNAKGVKVVDASQRQYCIASKEISFEFLHKSVNFPGPRTSYRNARNPINNSTELSNDAKP